MRLDGTGQRSGETHGAVQEQSGVSRDDCQAAAPGVRETADPPGKKIQLNHVETSHLNVVCMVIFQR